MKNKKSTLLPITATIYFLSIITGLAQASGGDDAAAAPHNESVLKIILNGGPLIIIIWLGILGASITMVTFVIQNLLYLRNEKLAPSRLVESLNELVSLGKYQEAWEACCVEKSYLANVLWAGLSRLGRGKEAVEDAIAETALREAQVLRTRNSYLSVIGVVSPMIGLLGTVIGMMGAFATLGASGISDPRSLATSIGEVLMATASGLFIAIPAFIFYYIFRNRSQSVIVYADDKVNEILADIPYNQLQGVHIGDRTSGVRPLAGVTRSPSPEPPGGAKLGTTKCPSCNGLILGGQSPCPHCGAVLDWSQQ